MLKSRAQQAGDPALAQSVMALFTEIMRLSREEQRRYLEEQTETKRIAYSGVPGAYSECAVVGFFGDDCERVNFKTFEEVFAAVADGQGALRRGAGGKFVFRLDQRRLRPAGQIRLPHRRRTARARGALPAGRAGAKVDEITQVFSHEQGFAQCPEIPRRTPGLGHHARISTRPSPRATWPRWAINTVRRLRPGWRRSTTGLRFSRRISTRLTATTRGLSSSARRPRPSAFRIRRPSPSLCATSAAR